MIGSLHLHDSGATSFSGIQNDVPVLLAALAYALLGDAAVIELEDDYNLNDLRLFIRAFSDTLTTPKDLDLMKEQSPMTYVDQMKTPLLMISDTGDMRVPVTQSYKLFYALRERGQDVRMIVYPVPGHFPARESD